MSFISLEFLCLVAITFAIYYAPGMQRAQVFILVAASLVFYAWDQWQMLPLLLATVGITFAATVGASRGSKSALALGIAANLAILVVFKYKFLLIPESGEVATGSSLMDWLLRLPLPIGISFFVFHNISLIADWYSRSHERKPPRLLEVLLYILFFPQLVSGPITRASSFLPQVMGKQIGAIPWAQVSQLVIAGLFFKLFCANNIASYTALMEKHAWAGTGGGDKLLLLLAYSFQIYADFFGYSLIALGLALLFGYRLPINFRRPYLASSFSDFWNRWHISLSRWLRQYLYIPLGGNRSSSARTYANLLTVMVLGGLWHGAALSYAVWGLAHGVLLATERLVQNAGGAAIRALSKVALARGTYVAFVFCCVSGCWLLFRFTDFDHARAYVAAILADPSSYKQQQGWYLLLGVYMSPVLLQHFLRMPSGRSRMLQGAVGVAFGCMLWLALAERGLDTQFIYFRF